MQNKKIAISYFYLILSGIFYGGIVFGNKVLLKLGFSLADLLILPNAIVGLCILPFVWKDLKELSQFPIKTMCAFACGCVLMQAGQILPLTMGLSISFIELLVYTQPIWTILFTKFVLKKKICPYDIWVVIFILIGLIILVNPFDSLDFSVPALVFGVGAGVGIASYVMFNSYFEHKNVKSLVFIFCVNVFLSIPFLISYPIIKVALSNVEANMEFVFNLTNRVWFIVTIYCICCTLLPMLLFFKGSKNVSSVHSGLMLLLEPIVAIILDVIFFHFDITWNVWIGGILIIGSNLFVIFAAANAAKNKRLLLAGRHAYGIHNE